MKEVPFSIAPFKTVLKSIEMMLFKSTQHNLTDRYGNASLTWPLQSQNFTVHRQVWAAIADCLPLLIIHLPVPHLHIHNLQVPIG